MCIVMQALPDSPEKWRDLSSGDPPLVHFMLNVNTHSWRHAECEYTLMKACKPTLHALFHHHTTHTPHSILDDNVSIACSTSLSNHCSEDISLPLVSLYGL